MTNSLFQLQSKYPMLYSILQNEASPELKQRIDRDRSKTTYQVDYCESGTYYIILLDLWD